MEKLRNNDGWTDEERDQFVREISESVIKSGGEVAGEESCELLLAKYRKRLAVVKMENALLKERLVKYETS